MFVEDFKVLQSEDETAAKKHREELSENESEEEGKNVKDAEAEEGEAEVKG